MKELTAIESALIDASNAIFEARGAIDDRDLDGLDASVDAALELLILMQACPERDEAYERAAARARNNDFAETGGKDWT